MNTKTAIGLILVFVTLPFAAASNQITSDNSDVSGRAILFDLTRFDPDLAAVAGHATSKVGWFDGAVTFKTESDGWVWAAPAGTPDPTDQRLFPTGEYYNFTDDNGATWIVQEWYYLQVRDSQYRLGDSVAVERTGYKVHVWTVRTSGEPITDAALGLTYNFVVVIDVTKLEVQPVGVEGEPTGPGFSADAERRGEVDLHFSKIDPNGRCIPCRAG